MAPWKFLDKIRATYNRDKALPRVFDTDQYLLNQNKDLIQGSKLVQIFVEFGVLERVFNLCIGFNIINVHFPGILKLSGHTFPQWFFFPVSDCYERHNLSGYEHVLYYLPSGQLDVISRVLMIQ